MGSLVLGLSQGKIPKREVPKHRRYDYPHFPHDGPPDAVGIHFAAKVIGVHSHTVRRWIKWRYIPAYRVNHQCLRIRRDHIMQITRALKVAMADPGWGDHYA